MFVLSVDAFGIKLVAFDFKWQSVALQRVEMVVGRIRLIMVRVVMILSPILEIPFEGSCPGQRQAWRFQSAPCDEV